MRSTDLVSIKVDISRNMDYNIQPMILDKMASQFAKIKLSP